MLFPHYYECGISASLQPTRIFFQNKTLVAFTCRNEVEEGSLVFGLCSPTDLQRFAKLRMEVAVPNEVK
jgi:hypothetical protein